MGVSKRTPAREAASQVRPARLPRTTRAFSLPASPSPGTKPPPKPARASSPRAAPTRQKGPSCALGAAPNSHLLTAAWPDPPGKARPKERAHLEGAPDAVQTASSPRGSAGDPALLLSTLLPSPPLPLLLLSPPTPPSGPRACAPKPGPCASYPPAPAAPRSTCCTPRGLCGALSSSPRSPAAPTRGRRKGVVDTGEEEWCGGLLPP